MATSRATPSTWPIRAPTRWSARRRSCSPRRKGATSGTSTRRCGGCSSHRRSSANASSAAKISASSGSTRCLTPGCASSARPRRKMGSVADRRLFWTTAGAVVAADLATKLLAESLLARHLPVQVMGDYVQLRLVYNQCAAFGLCLGAYSRWIFFGLAIAALFVLRSMVRSARPGDRFRIVSLALVCAGAVGNVVDRLRSAQGVVDFVDVGIGTARWPTFNVADRSEEHTSEL